MLSIFSILIFSQILLNVTTDLRNNNNNMELLAKLSTLECNDNCFKHSSASSASTRQSSFQPKMSCMCHGCDVYDDCCHDMLLFMSQNVSSSTITRHVNDNQKCNIKTDGFKSVYSIEKCADWWLNEANEDDSQQGDREIIRIKCENNSSVDSLIDLIPVYSNGTNQTYKNLYCAQCNFKDRILMSTLSFFEINSLSDEDPYENTSDDIELSLTELVLNELIEKQQSAINAENNRLTISFKKPQKYSHQIRECVKAIDTCPVNSSKLLKEFCSNHTATRFTFEKRVYKNKYCALCNNESDDLLCQPMIRRGFYPQSLQILFDLSNLYGELKIKIEINLNDRKVDFNQKCNNITPSLSQLLCSTQSALINLNNTSFDFNKACKETMLQDKASPSLTDYIKVYTTLIGQTISITSLVILLIIYFSNKVLRNLAGKILISLSLALLSSQITFLVSGYFNAKFYDAFTSIEFNACRINKFKNIKEVMRYIFSHGECYTLGFLTHYFYLAFFAWTHVMAYDLYRMFIVLSHNKRNKSDFDSDGLKFIKYSLYAWLMPLSICALTIMYQFIFRKTAYAFNRCFISDSTDLLLFFVLPITVILLTNSYFLIWSIISIRNVDKLSKKYLKKDYSDTATSSRHLSSVSTMNEGIRRSKSQTNSQQQEQQQQQQQRLLLFVKLFILSGMTWLIGCFNSIINYSLVWYAYIFLNSMQGLFIFFAFAFNVQTKRQVKSTRIYGTLSSMLHRKSTTGHNTSNQTNRMVMSNNRSAQLQTQISNEKQNANDNQKVF